MESSAPACNWESRSVAAKLVYCADFAAKKHKNQQRLDPEGTPYINHPLGVAKILTENGIEDINILQAAILHDTLEDTETTYEELEQEFGPTVAGIVLEVSDDKDLAKDERKRLQVLTAPQKSPSAKIVRMADKIYNLRDLIRVRPPSWTEERAEAYFEWAERVAEGVYDANETLANILKDIFTNHRKQQEAVHKS